MDSSLLDVCNGMFNGAGEGVHRNSLGGLCSLNGSLSRLHNPVALQGRDLNNLAAQLTAQLLGVDAVAVLLYHVHHIDGNHHRNAKLCELGSQVKVTLQVGAIDDIQDGIGALIDQIITGYHFLHGVGGQGVDTGQVGNGHIAVLLELAFLLLNGNAGPVTYKLVGAGQRIKQRCLTAVRVARKGNCKTHNTIPLFPKLDSKILSFLIRLAAYCTSTISASAFRRESS